MSADHNPYSPPRAPVADLGGASGPRPPVINIALTLLAIGFIVSLVDQFDLETRSRSMAHAFMGMAWPVIKFGVSCWLGLQIARGRNWARWVLLVVTLLILLLVAGLFASAPQGVNIRYDANFLRVAIELLPVLLYVVALCLLFGPGRAWFRPRR